MSPGRVGDHDADTDGSHDRHHHQEFTPDEELQRHQQPEEDSCPDRAATLSDQQLVEAGHDQWRHSCHPEHQVGICQL
jgi:hypothetical protein